MSTALVNMAGGDDGLRFGILDELLATGSRLAASSFLFHEHAIAIGKKTISFLHRVRVGAQDILAPGKG